MLEWRRWWGRGCPTCFVGSTWGFPRSTQYPAAGLALCAGRTQRAAAVASASWVVGRRGGSQPADLARSLAPCPRPQPPPLPRSLSGGAALAGWARGSFRHTLTHTHTHTSTHIHTHTHAHRHAHTHTHITRTHTHIQTYTGAPGTTRQHPVQYPWQAQALTSCSVPACRTATPEIKPALGKLFLFFRQLPCGLPHHQLDPTLFRPKNLEAVRGASSRSTRGSVSFWCWSTAGGRVGLSISHPGVGRQERCLDGAPDSGWILGWEEERRWETWKGNAGFWGYPLALRPAPVQTGVLVVGVRGGTCREKHVVRNVPPSFLT